MPRATRSSSSSDGGAAPDGKLLLDRPGRPRRPPDDRQPRQAQRARPRDPRRHRQTAPHSATRAAWCSPPRARVLAPATTSATCPRDVRRGGRVARRPPVPRRHRGDGAYPYPTVAALNGHAIGGGLELALTCDLRMAAARAELGMPPAKLGLVYSHTGLRKFLDVIGAARTRELFLTAAT